MNPESKKDLDIENLMTAQKLRMVQEQQSQKEDLKFKGLLKWFANFDRIYYNFPRYVMSFSRGRNVDESHVDESHVDGVQPKLENQSDDHHQFDDQQQFEKSSETLEKDRKKKLEKKRMQYENRLERKRNVFTKAQYRNGSPNNAHVDYKRHARDHRARKNAWRN